MNRKDTTESNTCTQKETQLKNAWKTKFNLITNLVPCVIIAAINNGIVHANKGLNDKYF